MTETGETGVVDMVKGPDGKWGARKAGDPDFFVHEPETPTTVTVPTTEPKLETQPTGSIWGQWQAGEGERDRQWQQFQSNADRAWKNFQKNHG